jgi:acyl-CoA dehydrogenase
MGIADGPTEVHKVTVAKQILRDYAPTNDLFPAYHIPRQREAARERFADDLKAVESAWKARRKAEADAEPVA